MTVSERKAGMVGPRQIFLMPRASSVSRNELNYCVRNGNRWTLTLISTNFMLSGLTGKQANYKLFIAHCQEEFGDPYRIRTDVKGVRGLCLNHLTNGPCPSLYHHQLALSEFWYTIRDSNPGHPD